MLDSSERCGRVADDAPVHSDHAGFEATRNSHGVTFLAEDVGHEAVDGIVGHEDCVVNIVVFDDGSDGTEDFRDTRTVNEEIEPIRVE